MNIKINPFNPNATVSSNLFAGRKEQILRVITKLEQVKNGMPASFFFKGERGIGKTALAKLVKSISGANDKDLGELNFLTAYYSVENGQNIDSALEFSLNELTDQLPKSVIEFLTNGLGNLFNNGKFSIGLFSVEIESRKNEQVIALKDQMVAVLTKLIDAMRSVEEEKKQGVVIIIDELHNVGNLEFCAQLFRGIATTLDVKDKGCVSFILIGYDETWERFIRFDSSARRLFDIVELDVMPPDEAQEVLRKGFDQIEIGFDESALASNIMVTGGYPHAIQMVGYNLVDVDKDSFIGADDWGLAIHKTAKELQTKEFADMYNFSGKGTMREQILDILAVAPRPLSKKEIKHYLRGKNIYQNIPQMTKAHSIRINTKDDTIELQSHLFKVAILLHLQPKIREENYLKDILAEMSRSINEAN